MSDDSIGKLKLKTVVLITGWNDKFKNAPCIIPINQDLQNGLNKKSSIDT